MPEEHVDHTVQHWNTGLQIVCISASTLCVALRVYTRMFVFNGLAKEDVGYHGGGLHIDNVSDHDERIFRKTVYGTMIIYGPAAYLTKLCLLWIMTRVFHPFRKAVILIYIFLGLMLAYYVPALIVKICICSPISKFWAPATPGTCLNQSKITLADAVISVVSDLIILIIPMTLVSTLHLPTRKKVRVIALLGAGGLACASSIARLMRAVMSGQGEHFGSTGNAIEIFRTVEISTEITRV
ncbi:hypothetical protein BDV38DRAFT_269618 [Aspergillus pseudotamarii]|uniref:PI-PLC Y-box domain-containing protein n=1 Tax=Aspergillus pseudotamarii TaxID=132259 RepID=A0A5N6SYT9_ASPPS|nr:uncharacterized protein BDV38DRAFT_269618 [Aspergillus pseudotamarii]KAE8139848.1 hypothetical protein BDV38DRAFT_269618 [Aspergillus pseudotamarii]